MAVYTKTPTGYLFHASLLNAGGPGTYIVLGPTGKGKTRLAKWLIKESVRQGRFYRNIVVLSRTAKLSYDWGFLQGKEYEHTTVYITKDSTSLNRVLSKICTSIEDNTSNEEEARIYKERNETLVVLDDFFGLVNGSYQDSILMTLAAQVRHIGGTLLLLTQKPAKLNDSIYDNSFMVFNFCRGSKTIKLLSAATGIEDDPKIIGEWSSTDFHFTMWIKHWKIPLAAPNTAVLCKPIEEGKPVEFLSRKFIE